MEPWFLATITAMFLAGFSNFYFKQAAMRGYDPVSFSLVGGMWSVLFATIASLIDPDPLLATGFLVCIPLASGAVVVTTTNVYKLKALHCIDATIYFPLFKLLAPILAIIVGVLFFGERFTYLQWIGIALGLSVHLLLITRAENVRQKKLLMGLLLVAFTSATSALAAVLTKYVVQEGMTPTAVMFFMSLGLCIGSVTPLIYRSQTFTFSQVFTHIQGFSFVVSAGMRSALISGTVFFTALAFAWGGTLSMVQTILSFYVLITVVLAIVYYNEHWNLQKAFAIVLSVLALTFFH
jgi:drug/metabolite transporter (DMT)-like permease